MWRPSPLILKSHGACEHSQPSYRGFTANRQSRVFTCRTVLIFFYSYWLQLQDGQDRNCLKLKTLRLVCSQFNLAFEAQVLSTLVILVTVNTLKQSLDVLWTFASQNKKASKAVRLARTLKIKYLSPIMVLDPKIFPNSLPEPESQDLSSSSPSLIRRLESAIHSFKRRFKWVSSFFKKENNLTWKRRKLTSKDIPTIAEEPMKEHLELAISSMKNLENVR